ncbi:hypothetical protein K4A83_02995 [Spirulina subsalsa FACHB-351]|uniref:Glycerophosphoryl diester phosphodiesterase membrane domain-containing protein n=1 Tax=Spirulina subsalsa FACHB-351 TaxID=234711 RepID=A0ABT3L164_9CYAN|nr:hypothetical protein [Spirulina subsalsa]MCW6035240.1 hypothetical protein [Spirulina subsalsa FACHB-351]
MQDNGPKNLSQLVAEGYNFQIEDYIKQGWQVFRENTALFITTTFFYLFVLVVIAIIDQSFVTENQGGSSGLSGLLQFFIRIPLEAGFYIIALKTFQGQARSFNDFFKGFERYFQLVAGGLVSAIFIIIGIILCVIPGIYLAVSYTLVIPLIVDRKLSFWEAMETSRQLVTKNWFSWFSLSICVVVINILGVLACGFGVLVSLPLSYGIWIAAYKDVVGLKYGNIQDT